MATGYEWVIGLGLMFALAFLFNYLTYNDLETFFIWLTIFNSIMVWAELLPLWSLIVCIIVLVILIYIQLKSKGMKTS